MADDGPRRAAGTSYEVIDGEAVVIDPDGQELITLNGVGTLVWEHLDGRRGITELVDVLLPQLDGVSREELGVDIRAYLDELRDAGLVE